MGKEEEKGVKVGKEEEKGVKVGKKRRKRCEGVKNKVIQVQRWEKKKKVKKKEIGIIEEIHKTSKDEKGQNEEGLKAEIAAKGDRKVSFDEVLSHEIIKLDSENLPILQITGSDPNITYVDKSIFSADTEDEDDDVIPLSQMEHIKAEDHMSDYKSSSTEEFDKNSQESDGLEEDEDESVSDESEGVEGDEIGEDADGKLHTDEYVDVTNGKNVKSVDDNG